MPKKGESILKFNNFHKQLPVPFVIYADFKAITKKVQGCRQSEEMEKKKGNSLTPHQFAPSSRQGWACLSWSLV